MLALQIARSVQLTPSPQKLAPRRVSNALAVTIALLAPHHGLVSIADAATTAPTALVLQRPAPTKCLLLADGALSKSKALHSSWKQPTASTTASGTLRQATACSANARLREENFTFLTPTVSPTNIAHAPPAHLPRSRRAQLSHVLIGANTNKPGGGGGRFVRLSCSRGCCTLIHAFSRAFTPYKLIPAGDAVDAGPPPPPEAPRRRR